MAASSPFERVLQAELLGDAVRSQVRAETAPAAFPTYGWASFRRPHASDPCASGFGAATESRAAESPAVESPAVEASREASRHASEPLPRSRTRRQVALERLGLDAAATAAEVRRAFRRLALAQHPDRQGGSHAAFVALGSAYREALACAG